MNFHMIVQHKLTSDVTEDSNSTVDNIGTISDRHRIYGLCGQQASFTLEILFTGSTECNHLSATGRKAVRKQPRYRPSQLDDKVMHTYLTFSRTRQGRSHSSKHAYKEQFSLVDAYRSHEATCQVKLHGVILRTPTLLSQLRWFGASASIQLRFDGMFLWISTPLWVN